MDFSFVKFQRAKGLTKEEYFASNAYNKSPIYVLYVLYFNRESVLYKLGPSIQVPFLTRYLFLMDYIQYVIQLEWNRNSKMEMAHFRLFLRAFDGLYQGSWFQKRTANRQVFILYSIPIKFRKIIPNLGYLLIIWNFYLQNTLVTLWDSFFIN